jgi:hypothetical protein
MALLCYELELHFILVWRYFDTETQVATYVIISSFQTYTSYGTYYDISIVLVSRAGDIVNMPNERVFDHFS